MQLDNTRVTIREREFIDLLDLSLRLIRAEFWPWLLASAVGIVPFAAFNYWILLHWPDELSWFSPSDAARTQIYLFRMATLMLWEVPLAAAPVTIYFGRSMFFDDPSPRRVLESLWHGLPQMVFFQVVLRGLFFLPAVLGPGTIPLLLLWPVPIFLWPYLSEVILLERNPLLGSRGRLTTRRRAEALHSGSRGNLFARWMVAIFVAGGLGAGLSLLLWYIRESFGGKSELDVQFWTVLVPSGFWIVAAYFAVVRYLSYLDLRIRREGWEVELRIRAAATRLFSEPSAIRG